MTTFNYLTQNNKIVKVLQTSGIIDNSVITYKILYCQVLKLQKKGISLYDSMWEVSVNNNIKFEMLITAVASMRKVIVS